MKTDLTLPAALCAFRSDSIFAQMADTIHDDDSVITIPTALPIIFAP